MVDTKPNVSPMDYIIRLNRDYMSFLRTARHFTTVMSVCMCVRSPRRRSTFAAQKRREGRGAKSPLSLHVNQLPHNKCYKTKADIEFYKVSNLESFSKMTTPCTSLLSGCRLAASSSTSATANAFRGISSTAAAKKHGTESGQFLSMYLNYAHYMRTKWHDLYLGNRELYAVDR